MYRTERNTIRENVGRHHYDVTSGRGCRVPEMVQIPPCPISDAIEASSPVERRHDRGNETLASASSISLSRMRNSFFIMSSVCYVITTGVLQSAVTNFLEFINLQARLCMNLDYKLDLLSVIISMFYYEIILKQYKWN